MIGVFSVEQCLPFTILVCVNIYPFVFYFCIFCKLNVFIIAQREQQSSKGGQGSYSESTWVAQIKSSNTNVYNIIFQHFKTNLIFLAFLQVKSSKVVFDNGRWNYVETGKLKNPKPKKIQWGFRHNAPIAPCNAPDQSF